jgi:hypothetical protein
MGHLTPLQILLYVAIAALVIWRVVFRQLRGTTVTVRGMLVIPGILVLIGLENCAQALPKASGTEIALLGADLLVLLILGAGRAASTNLTVRDGYAFQKGSVLTLLLWLLTIGVRIGFGFVGAGLGAGGPLTSASIALSLGLSIGVQNALIYARARRGGLRVASSRSDIATARR